MRFDRFSGERPGTTDIQTSQDGWSVQVSILQANPVHIAYGSIRLDGGLGSSRRGMVASSLLT